VSRNEITGDDIKTKGVSKEYENNFDRIFRKKLDMGRPQASTDKPLESCTQYPDLCFCESTCQKERQRAIAQNGNNGESYHWLHKHGHRPKSGSSPTYRAWKSMVDRCKTHEHYINNNINVSDRWKDFINFLADMGEKPKDATIDRLDNSLGYYKENCRWATHKQQSRNKTVNIYETINGKTQCLVDWAREYNIPTTTIYRRYHRGDRGVSLISPNLHSKKI
jgi:hypothetical protein